MGSVIFTIKWRYDILGGSVEMGIILV